MLSLDLILITLICQPALKLEVSKLICRSSFPEKSYINRPVKKSL